MSRSGATITIDRQEFDETYGRFAIYAAAEAFQETLQKNYGGDISAMEAAGPVGQLDVNISQLITDINSADYLNRTLGYGDQKYIVEYQIENVNGQRNVTFTLRLQDEDYDFSGNGQSNTAEFVRNATGYLLDPFHLGVTVPVEYTGDFPVYTLPDGDVSEYATYYESVTEEGRQIRNNASSSVEAAYNFLKLVVVNVPEFVTTFPEAAVVAGATAAGLLAAGRMVLWGGALLLLSGDTPESSAADSLWAQVDDIEVVAPGLTVYHGVDLDGKAFDLRQTYDLDSLSGSTIIERYSASGELLAQLTAGDAGMTVNFFDPALYQNALTDPALWGIDPAVWGEAWQGIDYTDASSFTIDQRPGLSPTASLTNSDGSQTNVYFGSDIDFSTVDTALADWGVSPEAVQHLSTAVEYGNAQSLTIQRNAERITATVVWEDGTQSVVSIPPLSGPILWEDTEYNAGGQVVSHTFETTIGGRPYFVTEEWELDEDGRPVGPPETTIYAYDPDRPDPDVMTGEQIGEIFGSELGSLIAGDNQIAQVVAGSLLATVLGQIGAAIVYFRSAGVLTPGPFSAHLGATGGRHGQIRARLRVRAAAGGRRFPVRRLQRRCERVPGRRHARGGGRARQHQQQQQPRGAAGGGGVDIGARAALRLLLRSGKTQVVLSGLRGAPVGARPARQGREQLRLHLQGHPPEGGGRPRLLHQCQDRRDQEGPDAPSRRRLHAQLPEAQGGRILRSIRLRRHERNQEVDLQRLLGRDEQPAGRPLTPGSIGGRAG
jgi:hypothetical protein